MNCCTNNNSNNKNLSEESSFVTVSSVLHVQWMEPFSGDVIETKSYACLCSDCFRKITYISSVYLFRQKGAYTHMFKHTCKGELIHDSNVTANYRTCRL